MAHWKKETFRDGECSSIGNLSWNKNKTNIKYRRFPEYNMHVVTLTLPLKEAWMSFRWIRIVLKVWSIFQNRRESLKCLQNWQQRQKKITPQAVKFSSPFVAPLRAPDHCHKMAVSSKKRVPETRRQKSSMTQHVPLLAPKPDICHVFGVLTSGGILPRNSPFSTCLPSLPLLYLWLWPSGGKSREPHLRYQCIQAVKVKWVETNMQNVAQSHWLRAAGQELPISPTSCRSDKLPSGPTSHYSQGEG